MTDAEKYISYLELKLKEKKSEKDLLALARLFELIGQAEIGVWSNQNKILYWKGQSKWLFQGIGNLIRSAKHYLGGGSKEEAENIIDRAISILKKLISVNVFDDEVIYALAKELLGDLYCLRKSASEAKYCYTDALSIYSRLIGDNPEEIETWQIQQEFEAVSAYFEELNAFELSDIRFDHYRKRLEQKIKRCS